MMNFRITYSLLTIGTLLSFALILFSCDIQKTNKKKNVTAEELKKKLMQEYPQMDEDDICLEEIKSFENLILVGSFANDRGCMDFQPYYFGVKTTFSETFTKELMNENGYPEKAEQLIKAFHQEIVNIENSIVKKLPEDSDSSLTAQFYSYSLDLNDDIYTSRMWIRHPSGMLNANMYSESLATFNKETGAFISSNLTNKITIYRD